MPNHNPLGAGLIDPEEFRAIMNKFRGEDTNGHKKYETKNTARSLEDPQIAPQNASPFFIVTQELTEGLRKAEAINRQVEMRKTGAYGQIATSELIVANLQERCVSTINGESRGRFLNDKVFQIDGNEIAIAPFLHNPKLFKELLHARAYGDVASNPKRTQAMKVLHNRMQENEQFGTSVVADSFKDVVIHTFSLIPTSAFDNALRDQKFAASFTTAEQRPVSAQWVSSVSEPMDVARVVEERRFPVFGRTMDIDHILIYIQRYPEGYNRDMLRDAVTACTMPRWGVSFRKRGTGLEQDEVRKHAQMLQTFGNELTDFGVQNTMSSAERRELLLDPAHVNRLPLDPLDGADGEAGESGTQNDTSRRPTRLPALEFSPGSPPPNKFNPILPGMPRSEKGSRNVKSSDAAGGSRKERFGAQKGLSTTERINKINSVRGILSETNDTEEEPIHAAQERGDNVDEDIAAGNMDDDNQMGEAGAAGAAGAADNAASAPPTLPLVSVQQKGHWNWTERGPMSQQRKVKSQTIVVTNVGKIVTTNEIEMLHIQDLTNGVDIHGIGKCKHMLVMLRYTTRVLIPSDKIVEKISGCFGDNGRLRKHFLGQDLLVKVGYGMHRCLSALEMKELPTAFFVSSANHGAPHKIEKTTDYTYDPGMPFWAGVRKDMSKTGMLVHMFGRGIPTTMAFGGNFLEPSAVPGNPTETRSLGVLLRLKGLMLELCKSPTLMCLAARPMLAMLQGSDETPPSARNFDNPKEERDVPSKMLSKIEFEEFVRSANRDINHLERKMVETSLTQGNWKALLAHSPHIAELFDLVLANTFHMSNDIAKLVSSQSSCFLCGGLICLGNDAHNRGNTNAVVACVISLLGTQVSETSPVWDPGFDKLFLPHRRLAAMFGTCVEEGWDKEWEPPGSPHSGLTQISGGPFHSIHDLSTEVAALAHVPSAYD